MNTEFIEKAQENVKNFFSDKEGRDKQVLIDGLKQLRKIFAAPALAEHAGEELYPGKHIQSDEELFKAAKEKMSTIYHPVGTCKMGNDELSVVDNELKVHGIEGLRVIDASIMPTLISGNTNAPTIAIAEKAADIILTDQN